MRPIVARVREDHQEAPRGADLPARSTEDRKVRQTFQVEGNLKVVVSEGERLNKLIDDVLLHSSVVRAAGRSPETGRGSSRKPVRCADWRAVQVLFRLYARRVVTVAVRPAHMARHERPRSAPRNRTERSRSSTAKHGGGDKLSPLLAQDPLHPT